MSIASAEPSSERPSPYAVPSTTGRHVLLRPIASADHEWLYRQAIDSTTGSRWRLHGMIPSADTFLNVLYGGAELSFLVVDRADGSRLGMVQLLGLHERHRFAYLSTFFGAEAQQKAWPLEGIALFLRYVFAAFQLRKIYVESLSPETEQYKSLIGDFFVEEGVLRQHENVFGTYYDMHIFAIYRERWAIAEERIFRLLAR